MAQAILAQGSKAQAFPGSSHAQARAHPGRPANIAAISVCRLVFQLLSSRAVPHSDLAMPEQQTPKGKGKGRKGNFAARAKAAQGKEDAEADDQAQASLIRNEADKAKQSGAPKTNRGNQ